MSDKSPVVTRRQAHIKYSKRPTYRRKTSGAVRAESLVEIMVMQCIVCGIVLSMVMLICIIKTPATLLLRENIHIALISNIDSRESAENIADITSNISLSFKNIFSPEKEIQAEENIMPKVESIPLHYIEEKDFRIDEDIINSIYEATLLEYDSEIKNIEAPQD